MTFATQAKALFGLGFLAAQLAAGSWAAVGEKNAATILRLNDIAKGIQGKQITPARMASLVQEMASSYAPKVSCSAGDRATVMSFSLIDVPFAQCGGAMAKLWGNLKVTHWQLENVAIDPSSGGKTILTYQHSDLVGMTNAGFEVPGTDVHKTDMSSQYTFNDQGLVTNLHSEFDSGVMQTIVAKVGSYSSGAEQMPAVHSWASVGEKNVATVSALTNLAREVQGKQVTPSLMAKLAQDMASFYAPEVSCSAGDRVSALSFRLVDVPFAECMKGMAALLGNTKILHWDMKSVAIDPASGGAKILTYQPFDLVGTTTGGMDVPGTALRGVDMSLVYVFNDMGQIASFHHEVDTGIIAGVQSKVAGYGRGILQAVAPSDWAEVGLKNVASLLKANALAKQMLRGQQLALPLLTKLFKESSSFYASQVSCSALDKQTSLSFSLSEVPYMECAGAFAQLFANVKSLGWDLENVAIDPASSGKTILTYQPSAFVGTTADGQEVPGTLMRDVDCSWKYHFNDQGLIAASHMEIDSGIIQGVLSKVASAQKEEGFLAGLPDASTDFVYCHIAMISAIVGGFIGVVVGLFASKRTQGPFLSPLLA